MVAALEMNDAEQVQAVEVLGVRLEDAPIGGLRLGDAAPPMQCHRLAECGGKVERSMTVLPGAAVADAATVFRRGGNEGSIYSSSSNQRDPCGGVAASGGELPEAAWYRRSVRAIRSGGEPRS